MSVIRNFEESEDELREAVSDSMKNLFVMEDGGSDEAQNREELRVAAVDDGKEHSEDGSVVNDAHPQHIQPEVKDDTSVLEGVISSEAEHDPRPECPEETQLDDNLK